MHLIDSNMLVYYYDSADNRKHTIAKTVINKVWKKEELAAISVQNLSEFYKVATEKIKIMSKKDATKIVRNFTEFSCWELLPITETTIRIATSLSEEHNTPYFDSLIVATMKEKGISEIITENEADFKKIPGIKAINPFK